VHALYLVLLGACVIGTLPLEFRWGARVYRRPGRWLLALLPVVVVFTAWDVWAIAAHHWRYDGAQTTGIQFGDLPLEELLFFVVIPTCSLLTLEAVRRVTGWRLGDEDEDDAGDAAAGS
jgi:lycopene cyclase domain-containing protein